MMREMAPGAWHRYISVENVALDSFQMREVVGALGGAGWCIAPQPAQQCHSRRLDAGMYIFEGILDDNLGLQELLADVLGLNVESINVADYITVTEFGGMGATWEQSGDACRTWLARR